MIGGCLQTGKYNMSAIWRTATFTGGDSTLDRPIDPDTGQVLRNYIDPNNAQMGRKTIACQIRGLTNLRGKDAGTIDQYGNRLESTDFVRIHTTEDLQAGDILCPLYDANGEYYNRTNNFQAYEVMGSTPTYDPFGNFIENIAMCNKTQVQFNLDDGTI